MSRTLDLYLIAVRKDRYTLFGPSDTIEEWEADSGDRIRHGIEWLFQHRNRFVRWLGKALRSVHGYYVRLEDRIDPLERVLKAIGAAMEVTVHHASSASESEVRPRFERLLKRQRLKHIVWFVIDFVISAGVVILTPILAPIPGPNVFFYYPVMRLLSHYGALRGTRAGLRRVPVQFKELPDLNSLEENFQTLRMDRTALRTFAERLRIRGLERFLERMV